MIVSVDRERNELEALDEQGLSSLDVLERQDLQEWIIERPEILNEDLLILTAEYGGFEQTRDRLDLLALDRTGRLVVIELKRETADRTTDLQAIKYASYCATLTPEQTQEVYRDFWNGRRSDSLDPEAVGEAFADFLNETADREVGLTETGWADFALDDRPRITLVAGSFGIEVTSPVVWLIEEYEFTSAVADRPVKVPITGPYTLASWCFNESYDDDRALALDLADLVNEEIGKLVEAGARYIQIDEPALATTPDDHAIVGDCLDRIVAGLPEDVRIGLHVCYGDYSRIYPEILDFPIDEFDVELANGDYEQLDVFKEPEFDLDLALGVTDAHVAEVESVEAIEANIEKGLEIVPPDRLTASPDCGVKLLPRDVAYGKMANMATAARNVERKLDAGEIDATALREGAAVSADD